jgi:hypothetical protein
VQLGEGEQRSAHQVDWVVVAERLAEHVTHTGSFEYSTHAATRDYTRTGSSRLQVDGARAVGNAYVVRDGAPYERHANHMLLRIVARLADRLGDLGSLTFAGAHHALTVADHDHGAEVEAAATLHHFGYTVDLN